MSLARARGEALHGQHDAELGFAAHGFGAAAIFIFDIFGFPAQIEFRCPGVMRDAAGALGVC